MKPARTSRARDVARQLSVVIAAVAVVAALAGDRPSAAPSPAPSPRVVAIGDIHGDFDALAGLLRHAGLIDDQLKWSGQNATLVQSGDMIDRGAKSRAVMDLLMSLQRDAPRSGGRVIVLLGNHEAMNLYGDQRYVSAGDYASFADGESEHRRRDAYAAALALRPKSAAAAAAWLGAHPPGFVEYAEALGPNGKYGKWLRSLPALALVDDTLFAHGGISPDFASWKIDHINDAIAAEIKTFDAVRRSLAGQRLLLPFDTLEEMAVVARLPAARASENLKSFLDFDNWLSMRDEGPLWFRGYGRWPDGEGGPLVDLLIDAFKVKRFVVGHTIQTGGTGRRFGDRVFLIDTGMNTGYAPKGRASALNIENGIVSTIYADTARQR